MHTFLYFLLVLHIVPSASTNDSDRVRGRRRVPTRARAGFFRAWDARTTFKDEDSVREAKRLKAAFFRGAASPLLRPPFSFANDGRVFSFVSAGFHAREAAASADFRFAAATLVCRLPLGRLAGGENSTADRWLRELRFPNGTRPAELNWRCATNEACCGVRCCPFEDDVRLPLLFCGLLLVGIAAAAFCIPTVCREVVREESACG
ncbi:CX domain-containing protein [Aphelenchoides fujianensis]|nr:CX domain-containing protein [Aphelenchoides fujianensis]